MFHLFEEIFSYIMSSNRRFKHSFQTLKVNMSVYRNYKFVNNLTLTCQYVSRPINPHTWRFTSSFLWRLGVARNSQRGSVGAVHWSKVRGQVVAVTLPSKFTTLPWPAAAVCITLARSTSWHLFSLLYIHDSVWSTSRRNVCFKSEIKDP